MLRDLDADNYQYPKIDRNALCDQEQVNPKSSNATCGNSFPVINFINSIDSTRIQNNHKAIDKIFNRLKQVSHSRIVQLSMKTHNHTKPTPG